MCFIEKLYFKGRFYLAFTVNKAQNPGREWSRKGRKIDLEIKTKLRYGRFWKGFGLCYCINLSYEIPHRYKAC